MCISVNSLSGPADITHKQDMEQMPSPIVKKCLLKDSPVAGLFFDAENTGWNAGMGFDRMKKAACIAQTASDRYTYFQSL